MSKTENPGNEAANAAETKAKTTGKGKATPSRKEAELATRKTIVSDRSPEAIKAAKAKLREDRNRARAGMAAGEEKYLMPRDRGPQKKAARDMVDSRFTVGEMMIPMMMIVLFFSLNDSLIVQSVLVLSMWTLVAAIIVDALILGRKVQKALVEKYGAEKVERGIRWYVAVRSTQMRWMRTPKPQVGRGIKK
jgi:hypothetical protein